MSSTHAQQHILQQKNLHTRTNIQMNKNVRVYPWPFDWICLHPHEIQFNAQKQLEPVAEATSDTIFTLQGVSKSRIFECVCLHIFIYAYIYTYILAGSYKVQYCNNSSNKNKSYCSVNRLHTIRILILWLSSAVNWRWRKSANRVARHLHMHVCIYLSAHLHLCTYICGKALGDEFRGGILL